MAVNDYAIVVGINEYHHNTLPNLKGPENDASAFTEWLISTDGGDVPIDNVELILSSEFLQGQPNVSDINHIIETKLIDMDLIDCSGGVGRKGRRLYLFFAGHGLTPKGTTRGLDEIALLTADASMLATGYHIAGKHYGGWFWDAALFEEIVLLMDCCRDTYSEAQLNLQPWGRLACDQESLDVRCFYAFSTQFSQPANEAEINGKVRGYFSAALTDGLKYAVDEEGRVTAKSLKDFIFNRMKEFHSDRHYQEADITFYPSGANGEEIVFCTPGVLTAPVTIVLKPEHLECDMVIMDGSFSEVEERPPSSDEIWCVQLPVGKKYMVAQKNDISNHKVIDVMTGEAYHVDF